MSEELLKIDKLPTIGELSVLLMEVLAIKAPAQRHDVEAICKNSSLNFALSFDNSIKFLSMLSLIQINEDGTILRSTDITTLQGDYALCIFITKRLIEYLINNNSLGKVFNTSIVSFDVHSDTFRINTNAIPLEFPMIKQYLINMGIASPESNSKGRILINPIYRPFFRTEVLIKVVNHMEETFIKDPEAGQDPILHMKTMSLFISYSHKDEEIKDELVKHLSGLRRMGLINEWNDRKIQPGEEWDIAIKEKLEQAEMILCLISSDFIASDYINDVEIRKALERNEQGVVKIIPIIVRPCDFESFPVSRYQALPKDAKAISLWSDRDEALLDVVNGIKKLVRMKTF